MNMNEFLSWEILASFAGASAATAVITQFIKRTFSKIPTQIISYAVALIVLIGAAAVLGLAENLSDWAIIPLNAVLISVAANGEFCLVKRIKGKKEE
jgi:hypothetical protein